LFSFYFQFGLILSLIFFKPRTTFLYSSTYGFLGLCFYELVQVIIFQFWEVPLVWLCVYFILCFAHNVRLFLTIPLIWTIYASVVLLTLFAFINRIELHMAKLVLAQVLSDLLYITLLRITRKFQIGTQFGRLAQWAKHFSVEHPWR
jgi:hypothetical protein